MFGGRIKHFKQNWLKISQDKNFLDLIDGISLDLQELPNQKFIPKVYKFSLEDENHISQEISSFLKKGIIELVDHCEGEIISNIFCRPKKSGKVRVILNLSDLNKDIAYQKFKMDTCKVVTEMIRPGFFFTSVDLQDAYFCVNVKHEFRKYLKFYWGNKLYQFTCLPQGLTSSPRIYTKIMKTAISHLREMGILISAYIDDLIIMAKDFEQCKRHVSMVSEFLSGLGFVVNKEKSVLHPSQNIEHLGFVFDSVNMLVKLTDEKKSKIIEVCQQVKQAKSPTIRAVASLIGLMVSYTAGVEKGLLHYRHLEMCKNVALKMTKFNFNKSMIIDKKGYEDIEWWILNVNSECSYLQKISPNVFIATDSSQKAWGAVRNQTKTGGIWNAEEQSLHINSLELKAIEYGLKALCESISHSHIRIKCDNTTAVAYINAKGGSRSIINNAVTQEIWNWALDRNNLLSAEHIPGKSNTMADHESRNQNPNTEWMLNRESFLGIINHFKINPTIDLFASRLNKQIDRFVSWKPDPESFLVDSFAHNFHDEIFYAFPPFSVLNKFMKKIEMEKMEGILVAPAWSTQNFFPFLHNLLVDLPLVLKWKDDLLLHPSLKESHPLKKRLRLNAYLLSSNHSKREGFLRKLQRLCATDGENLHLNNITITLKSGFLFVNNEIKIPLPRL